MPGCAQISSAQLSNVRRIKETRDKDRLRKALDNLRRAAEGRKENLMPLMIEAWKAYASHGEINGVMREAWGYPYDPFNMIENPLASIL